MSQNDWISIKTEEPPLYTHVLGCGRRGRRLIVRRDYDGSYYTDNSVMTNIVAWMPLPPKYEGE